MSRGIPVLGLFVVLFAISSCGESRAPDRGTAAGQSNPSNSSNSTGTTNINAQATNTSRPPSPTAVVVEACVTADSLRVRSGPGTEFAMVGGISRGECYIAEGRNSDSSWLQLLVPGLDGGWASAEYLSLDESPQQLAVTRALPTTTPIRPLPTITRQPTLTTPITPASPSGGSNCHPSYSGVCLIVGIGDYDCSSGSGNGPNYAYGPFRVVGPDSFGLDGDGDGIACEGG